MESAEPQSATDEVDRIRAMIQTGPMRRVQIVLVGIAVLINAIDGFDILSIAFIAPTLSREWRLDPERLGLLFSAGLFGMAVGAFVISWLVDLFGRRRIIVFCLALMTSGMLLAATASSPEILAGYRFVTGAGVGGMYAASSTLVFEFSSRRRRELTIGLVIFGYSFGTAVGGVASVFLLAWMGWHAVFLLGGLLAALMIPLVLWQVPESLEFLISRQPHDALSRINRVLARLDAPPLSALPAKRVRHSRLGGPLEIFEPKILLLALPIFVAKLLFQMSQYFVLNWTPKLMADAGFSDTGSVSFSIVLSLGGMAGGALVGFATARWGTRPIGMITAMLAALAIAAIGLLPAEALLIGTAAFFAGVAIFAGSTCLLTISAAALPVQVRGTGIGLAGGAGRLGSVLGAYLGGLLLALGVERPALCTLLALPALITMGLMYHISRADQRRTELFATG